MTILRQPVLAVSMLLFIAPLALAQGTYTQIDYPGATQTQCFGIDNNGDIVGYYYDGRYIVHGFVFTGGVFTTIDYPGETNTLVSGINDLGQIVGYAYTPTGPKNTLGFQYSVLTQTFTPITVADGAIALAMGINDAGLIVGAAVSSQQSRKGFELSPTRHRLVSPPESFYGTITSVSETGVAVGNTYTTAPLNFLFHGGTFEYPTWIPPNSTLYGINESGTAFVGYSTPDSGSADGFLYENGTLTTLQFGESALTAAAGVNDSGDVVGWFTDPSSHFHGFLYTPPSPNHKDSRQ